MHRVIAAHKRYWMKTDYLKSASVGLLFLVTSLVFNYFASIYATEHAGNSVADLLLDNLPVFNVDFIVNEGIAFFILYILILVLWEPKRLPFTVKGIALFYFIRSCFIMFTHLGLITQHSYIDPLDFFRAFSVGGDYFFSGHAGFPFLMALIFWQSKTIRNVCLFASVVFASSVILGHLHYSIDVFAAFFITYSIFSLAREFFHKDYRLLNADDTSLDTAKAPFAND